MLIPIFIEICLRCNEIWNCCSIKIVFLGHSFVRDLIINSSIWLPVVEDLAGYIAING